MRKATLFVSLVLICFLLCSCGKMNGEAYNIHLCFGSDAMSEMNVSWQEKGGNANSILTFYPAEQPEDLHIWTVPGEKGEGYYAFSQTITGFMPDTQYIYQLGDFEGSFRTAAAEGGFSFAFIGDTQAEEDSELDAASQYAALGKSLSEDIADADFLVCAGDLVNEASDDEEWNAFFAGFADILANKPFFAAIGNHDKDDLYKLLMNYPSGAPGLQDEYYSIDYQNAHICVINSNNIINDAAYQWLQSDLASSSADFKLAVMHHSLYTAANTARDEQRSANLRERFEKLFLENGVDIVMVGHEHVYMRTEPLAEGEIDAENGIIYLMGVAGSKSYSELNNSYSACTNIGEQVYTLLSVQGKKLSVKTFNEQDEMIDSFEISK